MNCETLIIAISYSAEMMALEPRYGFMYLKRTGSANGYVVHCFTDSLYENMMSCIQAANAPPMDTLESELSTSI
ncbi:uncharacterized protein TNCT_501971 [Trichonephila clavata]|uniref:Uncharacterized protein n=1 Tax=Trichonephila clavata TaxID=2740835 RepID=A0A8X6EY52_TRICU|nr:uncharacterized protein TNCT_13031 [Trichonephila clavata]GFQ90573.1 uncharacterized protein TNCT_501971 [Trichonephila clavata]